MYLIYKNSQYPFEFLLINNFAGFFSNYKVFKPYYLIKIIQIFIPKALTYLVKSKIYYLIYEKLN